MISAVTTSYALDWLILVIIAAAGGVLHHVRGYHRPFSLTETAIAYPHTRDIVSPGIVILISLIVPLVIILALSAALASKTAPVHYLKQSKWRTALWKVHVGWLGLAAALSTTLFITMALKDLVGKPRPDLLSICRPDASAAGKYAVGGLSNSLGLDSTVHSLVSSSICKENNRRLLNDSFTSFPSGYASFSWAGLLYLTLWMSARLSVSIPYLDHHISSAPPSVAPAPTATHERYRAAPPLWQVLAVLLPIATAIYICGCHYAHYRNSGFDIIVGALLGSLLAWASFRLYHMPVRRGVSMGGTWEPRWEFDPTEYMDPSQMPPPVIGTGAMVVPERSYPKSRKRNQYGETFTLRELEAGLKAKAAQEHEADEGRPSTSKKPALATVEEGVGPS